MPKNTRLVGHTLRSEGKPYWWSFESQRHVRTNVLYGHDNGHGLALCSCGTVSQMLHSNAERKRWHAIHKQVLGMSASPDSATEEG